MRAARSTLSTMMILLVPLGFVAGCESKEEQVAAKLEEIYELKSQDGDHTGRKDELEEEVTQLLEDLGATTPSEKIKLIVAIVKEHSPKVAAEMRRSANESRAIATLRQVKMAQHVFQQRDSDRNGVNDFAASLALLQTHKLIADEIGSGEKFSYSLTMSASTDHFEATAIPLSSSSTSRWNRHFQVTEKDESVRYRVGDGEWLPLE